MTLPILYISPDLNKNRHRHHSWGQVESPSAYLFGPPPRFRRGDSSCPQPSCGQVGNLRGAARSTHHRALDGRFPSCPQAPPRLASAMRSCGQVGNLLGVAVSSHTPVLVGRFPSCPQAPTLMDRRSGEVRNPKDVSPGYPSPMKRSPGENHAPTNAKVAIE